MAKQFYELGVRVNVAGFPMENSFHFEIDNPSVANEYFNAGAIIAQLATVVGGHSWLSRYKGMMSNNAYISNILCRRVSNGGGNTFEQVLQEDDYVGTISAVVAATQVAPCIIWVNATVPDRTGRNFIPAVPITSIDDGRFTSTFQQSVQAFITRHLTGFTISAGAVLPTTFDRVAVTGQTVTNGYLSLKIGTQRPRDRPL